MSNQSSHNWDKKIENAITNRKNLEVVFNEFTESEWKIFISQLVRESLPFSIPDFAFESPVICFLPILVKLNQDSFDLIGSAIEELVRYILPPKNLSLDEIKYLTNAFYIAYSVPIKVNLELLKDIASEHSIDSELRAYATRLVANQLVLIDIDWWKKLIETDYDSKIAPIAVDFLAEESLSNAINFLKELREPPSVSSFRLVIAGLLEEILVRREDQIFSLKSFPDWSFDYIRELVKRDDFKQLEDQWIRSEEGQISIIEYMLRKEIESKTKLPPKDYPTVIEDDEIAYNISRFLLKDDICRLFIIGEDESGTGLTSRVASIGYRYLEVEKDVFNSVVFIGSNVKNIDDLLLVLKDCLNDESIKKSPESTDSIINSLQRIYEIRNKKTLLIIDDFHQKTLEEKNNIGKFLINVQYICKVVIAINYRNDGYFLGEILQINDDKSEKIYLSPLTPDEVEVIQLQKSNRSQISKSITECYHGNPLAINLALATDTQLIDCPLTQEDKDPARHSFNKSVQLLDELSIEILTFISIFHTSEIFHDSSLSQESIEYILPAKFHKIKINSSISKLINSELVSLNNELDHFPKISISHSICTYILKFKNFSDEQIKVCKDGIFSRLTEYYIKFSELYGGVDWDNKIDFEKIEAEWYNITAILEWNYENNDFSNLSKIWFKVNRFSDLYGYWEDRKKWLDVLIEHYVSIDENIYAKCLASKGWSLVMSGDCLQAQKILEEAWELKNVNLTIRSYVAHNLTVTYYRLSEKNYSLAKAMIQEQRKIYENIKIDFNDQNTLRVTRDELQRIFINCARDEAKIEFLESNYDNAYEQYSNCLKMAEDINWIRMKSYFHYMLASTLISQNTLGSENFNLILSHIDEGVRIARNNNNRRRLACFKKLYADLLGQKGDSEADNWLQEAECDIQILGLNILMLTSDHCRAAS